MTIIGQKFRRGQKFRLTPGGLTGSVSKIKKNKFRRCQKKLHGSRRPFSSGGL